MTQLNRTFGTTVLILSSLGVMSCAPKMAQYKPDPERTSRLDRQTTQVTPSPEQKPLEPVFKEPWTPQFREIGTRDLDYYNECSARLRDGTYVAFAVTMSKNLQDENAEWIPLNYKVLKINPKKIFDETAARGMTHYLSMLFRTGITVVVTCPPKNNAELQTLLKEFLADPDRFIRDRPGIVVD